VTRPAITAHVRRLGAALPAPRAIAARLPRVNRKLAVRIWLALVIAWVIYTGPIAYADDPIDVTGPGGFFFLPDLAGDGQRLFFEKYIGFSHYNIYTEANWNDPLLSALNALANGLMYILVFFGASIGSTVGWLFSMTTIDGMATAVGNVMGASAEGTMAWLFPTTLILGGVVTYATRKSGNEGMFGNILWMILAGVALIVMSQVPSSIVTGVESARTAGADVVSNMATGATVNGESPIAYPSPDDSELTGEPADIAARKNIDAMWRVLVVTPWCLAELGSIEACEQYGTDIVTNGGDDRSTAIDNTAKAQSGSSTETWLKGKDTGYAVARVVVLLIALVTAGVFALFVLFAALTATFALVMAYLLLIVGPLFLVMGCIPGAPQKWVINWGRQVVVQLVMSIIAFTIFSAVLSLIAILFAATAAMGWLLSALLTMTALIAGIALRGRLEAIFNVGGDGGSGVGKYLLARQALRMLTHAKLPFPSRSPRAPRENRSTTPPPPPADSGGGAGGTPPALPAGRSSGAPPSLPAARQARTLPAGTSARQTAPRRDERAETREMYLHSDPAKEVYAERTTAHRDDRALPVGPSPARPRLAAGSTRAETAPRAAAPKTIRTSPTPASYQSTERVLTGEVIPPTPTPAPAPSAPSERSTTPRPHRPQSRVHFTRPDLPDAPRVRRASQHMKAAQRPDPSAHTRPVPGPRRHRDTESGRPRYRVPSYQ